MTDTPHYDGTGLLERIDAGLAALGENPAAPALAALSRVDEFHLRGRAATLELIALMPRGPGVRLLDVGSGLGGPARLLAAETGAEVTGVDLAADYCAIAETLSARTGLSGRTRFVAGAITDLSRGAQPFARPFDGAWTIHVGMNVGDKPAFYAAIAARLRPGGRFVIYDILRGPAAGTTPVYPLPWAGTPADSFLIAAPDLTGVLAAAGFAVESVTDDTPAALAFMDTAGKKSGNAPALGLHTVLGGKAQACAANLRAGLRDGALALGRLVCSRI